MNPNHAYNELVGVLKQHENINDKINPTHYRKGSLETIEVIHDTLGDEKFEGYLVGNIIKYVSRYNYKNGAEDLRKANWYMNRLILLKEKKI